MAQVRHKGVDPFTDLQRFTFALQEAQCRAICLENEKAKAKRKTPKTYLRNLKKTIARHKKARQVLASQGFHNIFSFISLKEREQLAGGRSLEGNKPPSCPSSGAVEESVGLDVGALSAIDEPCCSSPGGGTGGSLRDANMEASSLIGSSHCSLLRGGGRGGGRCLEENLGHRSSPMQDTNVGAVSTRLTYLAIC